eukprot:g9476.t1
MFLQNVFRNPEFGGRSVENRVYALGLAAYVGRPGMVSLLLQGAAVNKRRRGGDTALQSAVEERHRGIVEQLLAAGADVHYAAGPEKRTALLMAILKMLVQAGARLDAPDEDGYLAIHHAADGGRLPVLQELIRAGLHPECLSGHGQTQLTLAYLSGKTKNKKQGRHVHPRVLRSVRRPSDVSGYTPLAAAVQSGHLACVRFLLKRGFADLGPKDYRDSLTGLAIAGKVRTLKELALLDGGAHVAGAKTSRRQTALHFAAGY